MIYKMRRLPYGRYCRNWLWTYNRTASYGETWRWCRGDGKKTLRTFFCGLSGHKLSLVSKIQHYPPGIRTDMNCELCWYRAEKFTPIKDASTVHRRGAYVTAMSAGVGLERWSER
jgi:hypothetical protein